MDKSTRLHITYIYTHNLASHYVELLNVLFIQSPDFKDYGAQAVLESIHDDDGTMLYSIYLVFDTPMSKLAFVLAEDIVIDTLVNKSLSFYYTHTGNKNCT